VASPAQETKAAKYLAEGRLQMQEHSIVPPHALIIAHGTDDYLVRFECGAWICTCPAQKQCAHIVAAMKISPLRTHAGSDYMPRDASIDAILEGTAADVLPGPVALDPVPGIDLDSLLASPAQNEDDDLSWL